MGGLADGEQGVGQVALGMADRTSAYRPGVHPDTGDKMSKKKFRPTKREMVEFIEATEFDKFCPFWWYEKCPRMNMKCADCKDEICRAIIRCINGRAK